MISRQIEITTSDETEFVDLTSRIRDEVTASGLRQGRVHVQSLHTTLGLTVNENEPLLLRDFEALLGRLAPAGTGYHHDMLELRTGIPPDEPRNARAHCRALLLHPTLTVLVHDGSVVLGDWQTIFAVEMDGPRRRRLLVQLDGEFDHAPGPLGAAAEPDRELIEIELRRRLLLDPESVRDPMWRLVEAGGKRLRPLLVVLSSRLGADHDPLRAAALAAAVELIHDATLVHDDLVDEAATRRGRPTAWAKEGAARAIEVGDYYFARATRMIAELGNDAATRTIAGALEVICLAQIDDVELRGRYPGDYASYLTVVRGKTAALISAACQAGAELGGASPELALGLARYGELLGIAFQMVDDLLDYSERSGKPIGTDIRQRTLSLPLIYATEDARTGPELRALLAGDLDEGAVRRIQDMVRSSGALRRVGEEARGLARAAVKELDRFDVDGVRPLLAEIANQAVERVS